MRLLKALLVVSLLVFAMSRFASAQTTTVTLTVTDTPDNQTWNNGTWSAQLVAGPTVQLPLGGNIVWVLASNGTVVPNQQQSGSLSASGGATLTLTQNGGINPQGSVWSLTVCPQAAPSKCFTQQVTASGATQTVALVPPSIRISLTIVSGPVSAYGDGEMVGPAIGSIYYNLTLGNGRIFTPGGWANLGTGGGGTGTVVTNGATTVGNLPVFVTNALTLGNSLWTDNGSASLYGGITVGVGSGDPSCGSAVGCIGMTEGSVEGVPTAGHDYIRPDTVLFGHAMIASVNADGPFLVVRSRNTGATGQALLSNGDGTFNAADPNISIARNTLFSAQSATGGATSPSVPNPLTSGYLALTISGTGITGAPQGCQIALFYAQAASGITDATPFSTIFFTPSTTNQRFSVSPAASSGAMGDNLVGVYTCVVFPSAGTFTASFNPAMPIAPSGPAIPSNIAQIGGQALSQNIAISHDPSQTSVCSANSNAATNTITITGLVINAADTVVVSTALSTITGNVTVTDNGSNTYTQINRKSASANASAVINATGPSAALAATSVTVTVVGNQKFVSCVTTYLGVQSFGSQASNLATSTNPNVVLSTQDPGNFIVASLAEGSTNVMSGNQGNMLQTTQTTATTPASGAICDNTAAQPTTLTCGVTATPSTAWAAVAFELRSQAATSAALPITTLPNTPLPVAPQVAATAGNLATVGCDKTAISQGLATSGNTLLVAASGTLNIYVCGWTVNSASTIAVAAKLVVGTGATCATGQQDLSGQVTLQALSANSPVGQSITPPPNVVWSNNSIATPVASPALCVNLSSANAVNVQVWYAQKP